jgi:hypothetical protein
MQFDGVHNGIIIAVQVAITKPCTYSNFVFNPPIELSFLPKEDDIIAFGEYRKITTQALCFGKKSERRWNV